MREVELIVRYHIEGDFKKAVGSIRRNTSSLTRQIICPGEFKATVVDEYQPTVREVLDNNEFGLWD